MPNTLVLEISLDNYIKHAKPASFLIKTLGKKYNILFALSDVTVSKHLKKILTQSKFDFIMLSPFSDDASMTSNEIENIVEIGKKFSCLSIANKIENNDAMMTAMGCEFDFISGYFVQPPQENIMGSEVVEVEV